MASVSSISTNNKHLDKLFDTLNGFRSSMIVYSACKLDLFDKLYNRSNYPTATQFAEEHSWNCEATSRLLNTLCSLGFVDKIKQNNTELYKVSKLGEYLRKESDTSWYGYVHEAVEFPMDTLVDDVKTGGFKDPSRQCGAETDMDTDNKEHGDKHDTHHHGDGSHGHQSEDHHHDHHHEKDTKSQPRFMMDMDKASDEELYAFYMEDQGFGKAHAPAIVRAFDLSKHKTAIDLGGGTGFLCFELARAYPKMQVTLFELQRVADMVKHRIAPKDGSLNVKCLGGDYYKDPTLPPADLFIISMTIHCMSDDMIDSMFKKVHAALNPGGSLMLVDYCLDDTRDGPTGTCLWDVMVMGSNGRVRTANEFSELMIKNGFHNTRVCRTQETCAPDVIYADKK